MQVFQLNERVRVLVGPPDPIAWDIRGRPGTVTQVWDGVFASAGNAAGQYVRSAARRRAVCRGNHPHAAGNLPGTGMSSGQRAAEVASGVGG